MIYKANLSNTINCVRNHYASDKDGAEGYRIIPIWSETKRKWLIKGSFFKCLRKLFACIS